MTQYSSAVREEQPAGGPPLPATSPTLRRVRLAFRVLLATVIATLIIAVGLVAWVWARLQPLSLARAETVSVTVLDRNDRLLRAYTAPYGRWRLPAEVKGVDPRYLAMLIAYEDKRF